MAGKGQMCRSHFILFQRKIKNENIKMRGRGKPESAGLKPMMIAEYQYTGSGFYEKRYILLMVSTRCHYL
jgi:hypothetical protein